MKNITGGSPYGLTREPNEYGSGGGNGTRNDSVGGAGGGCLHLTVFGAITLDGKCASAKCKI